MDILKIIGLRVDEPQKPERDDIDLEIERLTEKLKEEDPLSENYPKLAARLKGLYEIKDKKLDTDSVPEPTFFQKYGETIIAFLTRIRMEKAAELMKNQDKKLETISFLVGYDDYNYFSRVFRKKMGCSPREYRNKFTQL